MGQKGVWELPVKSLEQPKAESHLVLCKSVHIKNKSLGYWLATKLTTVKKCIGAGVVA